MFAQSFRSSALLSLLLTVVAVLPSSLRGQAADRGDALRAPTIVMLTPATATESALAGGPRVAPVGVVRQATPLDLGQPQRNSDGVNAGQDVAMMGVGAAGIVVGLLVGGNGGTIIALSGGVIGLVGLFRYLR
jgi:hypothetical protein